MALVIANRPINSLEKETRQKKRRDGEHSLYFLASRKRCEYEQFRRLKSVQLLWCVIAAASCMGNSNIPTLFQFTRHGQILATTSPARSVYSRACFQLSYPWWSFRYHPDLDYQIIVIEAKDYPFGLLLRIVLPSKTRDSNLTFCGNLLYVHAPA